MATILIVDDELIIQQMIASVIEDAGYRALVAADGRAALALLAAEPEPPALIITDLMMPHLNGAALAREVRANSRLRDVPIVLMSAACHAHQSGAADHFLAKPFELDEIDRFIERYVEGTGKPAAVLSPEPARRQAEYQRAVGR
jgi:CheY-like chemotaxis protein